MANNTKKTERSPVEPSVIISLLGLAFTVVVAISTSTWRLSAYINTSNAELSKAIGVGLSELRDQVLNVNNAMLSQVRMTEDALEDKMARYQAETAARILQHERELADFKLYVERTFVDKPAMNSFLSQQSTERQSLRVELVDRFNELDEKLDRISHPNSRRA